MSGECCNLTSCRLTDIQFRRVYTRANEKRHSSDCVMLLNASRSPVYARHRFLLISNVHTQDTRSFISVWYMVPVRGRLHTIVRVSLVDGDLIGNTWMASLDRPSGASWWWRVNLARERRFRLVQGLLYKSYTEFFSCSLRAPLPRSASSIPDANIETPYCRVQSNMWTFAVRKLDFHINISSLFNCQHCQRLIFM